MLSDEEISKIEDEYVDNYRIPAGDAHNFARAIEAAVIERIDDALMADLEHGVKSLNERAAREFYSNYPELAAAIRGKA